MLKIVFITAVRNQYTKIGFCDSISLFVNRKVEHHQALKKMMMTVTAADIL
jgi:hypothetical protein